MSNVRESLNAHMVKDTVVFCSVRRHQCALEKTFSESLIFGHSGAHLQKLLFGRSLGVQSAMCITEHPTCFSYISFPWANVWCVIWKKRTSLPLCLWRAHLHGPYSSVTLQKGMAEHGYHCNLHQSSVLLCFVPLLCFPAVKKVAKQWPWAWQDNTWKEQTNQTTWKNRALLILSSGWCESWPHHVHRSAKDPEPLSRRLPAHWLVCKVSTLSGLSNEKGKSSIEPNIV